MFMTKKHSRKIISFKIFWLLFCSAKELKISLNKINYK